MKRQKAMKILVTVIGICWGLAWGHQNLQYVKTAENRNAAQERMTDEMDITELSQIMTAGEAVDMKAAPERNAETIMSYEKGASVFVTGETNDGWYRVIYQDKEGYITKDALYEQEIDVAGLDAEMAQAERETKFVVESIERYRGEAKRSRIWGGVIIALVAGIFAVGILSGARSGKNKKHS